MSRFNLLQQFLKIPEAVARPEASADAVESAPRNRFEAIKRIVRIQAPSFDTPPTQEQVAPVSNDLPPTWEIVIEKWESPKPSSAIEVLKKGVRGYAGLPPRPELHKAIVADMKERDKLGRDRYGTPLQACNGRDSIVDAYQEALDLRVYVENADLEGRFDDEEGNMTPTGLLLMNIIDGLLVELRGRMTGKEG
jgi:hypothetical protein